MLNENNNFDLEQMAAEFTKHARTADQQALVKHFKQAVVHCGNDFKMFLSEVCHEAQVAKLPPVNAMGLATMYGLVLGVLMERQRRKIV